MRGPPQGSMGRTAPAKETTDQLVAPPPFRGGPKGLPAQSEIVENIDYSSIQSKIGAETLQYRQIEMNTKAGAANAAKLEALSGNLSTLSPPLVIKLDELFDLLQTREIQKAAVVHKFIVGKYWNDFKEYNQGVKAMIAVKSSTM